MSDRRRMIAVHDAQMFAKTLVRAAELVEQSWCQYQEGSTVRGSTVTAGSRRAESWCALGAVKRAAKEMDTTSVTRKMLREVNGHGVGLDELLADINDDDGQTSTYMADFLRRWADRVRETANA